MNRTITQPLLRSALPAIVAAMAMAWLPSPAPAATDPDGDPAVPMAVDAEPVSADLAILTVDLWKQETVEGTPYLRIDYEVENLGSETVYAHQWQLTIDGVTALAAASGAIEPGAVQAFSHLVFGADVATVVPGKGVAVASVWTNKGNCDLVLTQDQCQAHVGSAQPFCEGQCIGDSGTGGTAGCARRCFRDNQDRYCCTWDIVCNCQWDGMQSLTLTESLAEGLINPLDPVINPAFGTSPLIETRQLPNGP